jgi:hypothetical protein
MATRRHAPLIGEIMVRRESSIAVVAGIVLATSCAASAMTPPRTPSSAAALVPVVSSDAHKGIGGRYGVYKSLKSRPSVKPVAPKSDARKQPYPSRYYGDTSRGNYGCHRYGKRAIDTDNKNWWLRYKACTQVGND